MTVMPEPANAAPAKAAASMAVAPAAVAVRDAADVLACGRPVAGLVNQADGGRLEPVDAHQASCRHCQTALRDTAISSQALELLRATRGPVPAGLVDRVLDEVRRHRDSTSLIELAASGRRQPGLLQVAGGVRVHQQVVADLARRAATAVYGVTVARANATGRPGQPGGVDVALGLLVDGRTPLPQLARTVRRAVRAALRRALGAGQIQVQLTALDLLDEHT